MHQIITPPEMPKELMRGRPATKCLPAGEFLTVDELEQSYRCQRRADVRSRAHLSALQTAVSAREAEMKKLQESTK